MRADLEGADLRFKGRPGITGLTAAPLGQATISIIWRSRAYRKPV
jgi:hypothetical protein